MTATSIGVAEAAHRVVDAVRPLPAERVPLLDALGRVLAERVAAPVDLPAWDNSAMDGYAVRAADVAGAAAEAPARLRVVETIAAGVAPARALGAGEAARIMTGAPMPPGADAVVRVEDTDAGLETVAIVVGVDVGTNVRYRGEVLARGAVALDAGAALGPAQLGILASCGAATLAVHRRPRVGILSGGDELVELDRFDEVLAGRRIAASNGYALHAAVRAAGGEPVMLGIAIDTPESVRAGLERAAGCDLALTSGGMSVGAFDHVRDVVAAMAGRDASAGSEFWRVRMRPGAPVGFGRLGTLGGMPWIGLPGNPVSALVTFELFARPALRRLLGHRRVFHRPVPVTLAEPITTAARLTHFLRAVVEPSDDGRLVARLTGPQGSHDVTSTARANALLVVPEAMRRAEAGSVLGALLLDDGAALAEECAL